MAGDHGAVRHGGWSRKPRVCINTNMKQREKAGNRARLYNLKALPQ